MSGHTSHTQQSLPAPRETLLHPIRSGVRGLTHKETIMVATSDPADKDSAHNALALRLGRNIAAQRKAVHLTQAQLAERLRVETEAISRFERGKTLPSILTLERLGDLLGCTPAALLGTDMPSTQHPLAVQITSWLAPLDSGQREFAFGLLKYCCDQLADQHNRQATAVSYSA